MQDGKIEIGEATRVEMFGENAHQAFADARLASLGVNRKAPERGTAFRIIEQAVVVDAGDGSDDLAGQIVLRDEIGDRPVVALAGEEVLAHLDHAAIRIDRVDARSIAF